MRILAVSDIHGSQSAILNVKEKLLDHSPDVLAVCGDITDFGPASWAYDFLRGFDIETLAIPGNCDPRGVLGEIERSGAVPLHHKKVHVGDQTFVGIGGSNPTPFNTPFEWDEDEAFAVLDGLMEPGAVLVSHAPPKGHLDRTSGGLHVGSGSVLGIIEKYQPPLVLCGHIHEARGLERVGGTTIVNTGMAARGLAAVVDIEAGEVEAKLLGDE